MKKHLIIGNPVEHSLSPKIHNYWLKKNNIDGIYEKKLLNDNQKLEEIFKELPYAKRGNRIRRVIDEKIKFLRSKGKIK